MPPGPVRQQVIKIYLALNGNNTGIVSVVDVVEQLTHQGRFDKLHIHHKLCNRATNRTVRHQDR
jgi:hypothetical protein